MPMTISEITEVPSDRRKRQRAPSPHTASSTLGLLPSGVAAQQVPGHPAERPGDQQHDETPGIGGVLHRRCNVPEWYPNARCWTVNRTSIIKSPNSPVATPVSTTMTQNRGVSAASPSPVAFGCSVAPRPDGIRC